jgi:hypothetical protein
MSNEHELQWTPQQTSLSEARFLNPLTPKTDKPGYIAFAREENGQWVESTSIPTYLLHEPSRLPGFENWVEQVFNENSYFTINSFYRPGSTYSPDAKEHALIDPITGRYLLRPKRDKDFVKQINAAWVDLDYYKRGLTKGTVVGKIIDATEAGLIPMPTMLRDSGRGLWVLWALDNCGGYEDKRNFWAAVQRKLHSTFASLGSDPKSLDVLRYTRLLGSLNTKSNTRVSTVVLADDTGNPPRYRLKELADKIGVVFGKQKRLANPQAKQINREKGFKGYATRWTADEARFWELVDIRGNIPLGLRNAHNQIIGMILKYRYFGDELPKQINLAAKRLFDAYETQEGYQIEPLRKNGRQPDGTKLNSVITEIRAGSQPAQGEYVLGHKSIADILEITPSESAELQVRTGKKPWPPSSEHDQPLKLANRTQKKKLRQDYIELNWKRVVELTAVELAEHLTEKGLDCDQSTAHRDRAAVAKRLPSLQGKLFEPDSLDD